MITPPSPDGTNVPHFNRCASCHGDCTKLHQTQTYGLPPKPVYTCVDRELCKITTVFEHMLATTRSS